MSIDNTHINGDAAVSRNTAIGGNATIQGNTTIGHNLKVEGWLDAPNVKGANKGIFLTTDDLETAYTNPEDGWFAGVGTSSPFALYVGKNGAWVNTGGTLTIDADFTELSALREEVSLLKNYIGTIKDVFNEMQNNVSIVNIITEANEGGSVQGGGYHVVGTTISLYAIANEGYHFVQWSDGNTDTIRTIVVSDTATYTAQFALDNYTIVAEPEVVSGTTHGTASVSGSGDYLAPMTATAVANEGYTFEGWYDENDELVSSANPYVFAAKSDTTLTAKFSVDSFNVVVQFDATMAIIRVNGNVATNNEAISVPKGTDVVIVAEPKPAYNFTRWQGDSTSTETTITFTEITADINLVAELAIKTFTITASSNDSTMGDVSPKNTTVNYGGSVTLVATPSDANTYEFVQWSDGNTDATRTISNITANATYTATFRVIPAKDYYVGYVNVNDISDFQALTSNALQNASTGYLLENATQYSGNVPSGMTCMFMMVKEGVTPASGTFVSDNVPTTYTAEDFQDTDIFDMTHDPVSYDNANYTIIGVLNPLFKSTDTFTINFE